MEDFINKLYRNHSLIYKGLLFICTTFLIVYLFPKSGKFKYNFEKGKPWQSEVLLAPFDFAIKKNDAELTQEKQEIANNSVLYFDLDNSVKTRVTQSFAAQFKKMFSDSLPRVTYNSLFKVGQEIISEFYIVGVLGESYNFSETSSIVILEDRVKKQEGFFSEIIKQDAITPIIEKSLLKHNLIKYKKDFISLFFDLIEPNLVFNKSFTEKALQEDLNKIALVRGSVEKGTLIISKGEVVDAERFQILKSLQSEFESQEWGKSNYNWIIFAYTLLVALALLMLYLFLRKYRREVLENNKKVTFIFFNIFLMIFITTLVVNYDSKFIYVVPICILPLIFYKIYLKNPESFAYNKEYLLSQKQFHKNDFDKNDNKFIEIKSQIIKNLNKSNTKKTLPIDSDTLIFLENFIVLSPQTIRGGAGVPAPKTYIKLYDKLSGKLLFVFEKKSNVLESYNYYNSNLNFRLNKFKKPEIGISYFDFWCSSIGGFKDNLINPLRNWIILLNSILIAFLLMPILNYIKNKFLSTKSNSENKVLPPT